MKVHFQMEVTRMGKYKDVDFDSNLPLLDNTPSLPISVLKDKYYEWAKGMGYKESSQKEINLFWNRFENVMASRNITEYTVVLGERYLSGVRVTNKHSRTEARIIYVCNCILLGVDIPLKHVADTPDIPTQFREGYDSYISHCIDSGNSISTIKSKKRYCRYLIVNLLAVGCDSFDSVTPEKIVKAALRKYDDRNWSSYRLFLRYLADYGFLSLDYSGLVPTSYAPIRLPDVYSKEEIEEAINTINREEKIGKKKYAIIMIASRLNLRNSDIVNLKFDDIDFERQKVYIIQEKTDEPLELPLVPEVKIALEDYIKNARPASNNNHVFLRDLAPVQEMSPAAVYNIISRCFEKSSVDTSQRRKGGHALRASGATSKVNSGMSYNTTRKTLGQRNNDVLKHYARIDIENLRKCALEPPNITEGSVLSKFLSGEIKI